MTEEDAPSKIETLASSTLEPTDTFLTTRAHTLYEKDEFAWHALGRHLFDGENYANNNSHTYSLSATDPSGEGRLTIVFTGSDNESNSIAVTINGTEIGKFSVTPPGEYIFATATTLTAENTFREFFRSYSNLIDASGLLLPATTLTNNCYYEMFYSCSGMTAAPAELPAETLASSCYYEMFSSCSKLTAAPVLPAKTLVSNCYKSMFSYCSKLSSVTCLATSGINSNNSTNGWLTSAGWQAAGVKTFTAASGAEWPEGNNGIPTGWTRVNQ